MKKMKKKMKKMKIYENHIHLYFIPHVTFHPIFCMHLLSCMFSTLMSLEDRLRLKLKVKNVLMYGYNAGPPMAIPIYTVLPYCVIKSSDKFKA